MSNMQEIYTKHEFKAELVIQGLNMFLQRHNPTFSDLEIGRMVKKILSDRDNRRKTTKNNLTLNELYELFSTFVSETGI